MKFSLIIVALCCALTARAEIDLPDAENVTQQPPQKRPVAAPVQPAETKPAAPTTPPPPLNMSRDGLLRFRNGDILHGLLSTVNESGQVVWRSPEAPDPLRFSMQNVMQISLPGSVQPATGNTTVSLTNGDLLRGEIVSLDGETLVLDTWYAGRLKIKRAMIRCLSPGRVNESVLVNGLSSLDGWTLLSGAETWQLRSGVLSAPQYGSIGRDVGLPNRASIEFDLAWQQYPFIVVGLYVNRPEGIPEDGISSGYWLMLSANIAQLQRIRKNDHVQMGQAEIHKFLRAGKAHVAIYVDKTTRQFTLVVDGQLVKTWTDGDEFAGDGTCLTFSTQRGSNQMMHLGNLLVRQWVGDLDNSPTVVDKQDVLCLANSDRLAGQVKSIQDGTVIVTSTVTPLSIPLERVRDIYLAADNAERARRLASDVLAFFNDGGQVTIGMDSLDEKHLTGHSENFGKASFDRAAFQELQLHIYDDDRGDKLNDDPIDPSLELFNGTRIFLRQ